MHEDVARVGRRASELFENHLFGIRARVDRVMAGLMLGQWVFAILIAVTYSPYAWEGKVRAVHAHVWAATLLGGAISSLPIALALLRPGAEMTRFVIASAQMLWSALLIHLTGGRIETHFHVFGSLAFLAFYRDWRVFVPATILVAGDHLARQIFWPESVYGVVDPEAWRFLEHAFWVAFEDVFLVLACLRGVAEVREISHKRAELEDLSEREKEKSTQLDAMLAETIQSKNAAERANQVKGQFLANMSHELRTPLNGVLGMTELLGRTELSDKQRKYVDAVQNSGQSLLIVVNDILDFSKVDAGKLALQAVQFDAREVARAATDLFAASAHRKGVELVCALSDDLARPTIGDPGRLQQVLNNLVANAVKFTQTGEVVVRGGVEAETPEHLVLRFTVSDTGIGIPAEHFGSLFDAFSQIDSSNSRRYGGTGLGLAIAKQLVEMMGGAIEVRSVVGKGSIFTFTVRVRRGGGTESVRAEALVACRVLVVDDNETNRLIVREQLGAWTTDVDCADGGPAALALFDKAIAEGRPYRVVILDMQMPRMDGMAVARALRARTAGKELRILMLTSVVEPASPEQARAAGIDECLTKPVHSDKLLRCLRVLLGSAPREPDRPAVPTRGPPSGPCLLLVEDNAVNQEVALEMLSALGYRVDLAPDGRDALSALERNRYAAVLMDCQLPEMSGYDVTRELRRRETGSRTPVIGLTAHAMVGDEARAMAAGMDDYLTKPLAMERLATTLERWVAGRARLPSEPVPSRRVGPLDPTVKRSARVLELFLAQLPVAQRRMADAQAAGDAERLKAEAHRLKGSAVSVGARDLAERCADIERSPERSDAVAALAQCAAVLKPVLEAELASARTLAAKNVQS